MGVVGLVGPVAMGYRLQGILLFEPCDVVKPQRHGNTEAIMK